MTETYLTQQAALHRAMQPRDVIKLLFQSAFGAEHLIADEQAAHQYFQSEWDETGETNEPLFERISCDMTRVNLGAWKASRMPAQWLFSLFLQGAHASAQMPRKACEEAFLRSLLDVDALVGKGIFCFDEAAWQEQLTQYRKDGIHAVHHSAHYRACEHPAYRVVPLRMARLIPVLQRLHELCQNSAQDKTIVLALDGRAASGKSTAADVLCSVLDVDAIHLDDFFLPPSLRSEQRLLQAGGNVHYERFAQEVLPQLAKSDLFCYSAFDCSRMALGEQVSIAKGSIRLVEGSYSHHPFFGDYADLRVFFDVDVQEQLARIRTRNGEEMAQIFQEKWIPMEERYFDKFDIRKKADIILN